MVFVVASDSDLLVVCCWFVSAIACPYYKNDGLMLVSDVVSDSSYDLSDDDMVSRSIGVSTPGPISYTNMNSPPTRLPMRPWQNVC